MSRRLTRRCLLAGVAPLLAAAAWRVSARLAFASPTEIALPPADVGVRDLDARLLGPAFRLVVPFRTQKDGSRWQTSNCGPATLGMVLDGFGIGGRATDDLRFQMHTYQGTVGMRTGTGLEHVAHVAEDLGIGTHGLYNPDGSFRTWQIADVIAELRQGRPVMPLVRLYLVPGYEGLSSRWGHYILLTGVMPGGFTFSDSLKTDPTQGTTGQISESQLAAAIRNSHIPGQAVAYAGPGALPILTP
jgi:hypothetical protein